ncbi:hypothetical protein PS3A_21060 [Pseudomonas sp. 3A(2025)]
MQGRVAASGSDIGQAKQQGGHDPERYNDQQQGKGIAEEHRGGFTRKVADKPGLWQSAMILALTGRRMIAP